MSKTPRVLAGIIATLAALQVARGQPAPDEALRDAIRANDASGITAALARGADPNGEDCAGLYFARLRGDKEVASGLEAGGGLLPPRRMRAFWFIQQRDLVAFAHVLEDYRRATGRWPTHENVVEELGRMDAGLGHLPLDRWGRTLIWRIENEEVVVSTLGADGQPGGTGFARDIRSDETVPELAVDAARLDPNHVCERLSPPHALLEAIDRHDVDAVRAYLTAGGDPNAEGCVALGRAWRSNQPAIALLLEQAGAIPRANDLVSTWLMERQEVAVLSTQLRRFHDKYGHWPEPDGLPAALDRLEFGGARRAVDYWGHAATWKIEAGRPVVVSLGADGKVGGAGFARDIMQTDDSDTLQRAAAAAEPDGVCRR